SVTASARSGWQNFVSSPYLLVVMRISLSRPELDQTLHGLGEDHAADPEDRHPQAPLDSADHRLDPLQPLLDGPELQRHDPLGRLEAVLVPTLERLLKVARPRPRHRQ